MSSDVEDRRGQSGGGRGLKLGGIGVLVVVLAGALFGVDVRGLLGGGGGGSTTGAPPDPATDPDAELKQFVSFVLDDAQDAWSEMFAAEGWAYQRARMIIFTRGTPSGCGYGDAAIGPFYCPADQRVYIDLSFFRALRERFGAPGDFAVAYVIAHEIGHHVQHLRRLDHPDSVRVELQADCFAGMWAHTTKQRDLLERGDIEEALGAAQAIGDDQIQKMSGREVNPESWTHGSSAQRMRWFRRGYDAGRYAACDTFTGSL